MHLLLIGLALGSVAQNQRLSALRPNSERPAGVVVDRRGPPQLVNFKLVELVYLQGVAEPVRIESSCGGWLPYVSEPQLFLRRNLQGFEARKVGETKIELTRYRTPDGVMRRITKIEYQSPDLPPWQLPKVTMPPRGDF